jgi:hypothetical protein
MNENCVHRHHYFTGPVIRSLFLNLVKVPPC